MEWLADWVEAAVMAAEGAGINFVPCHRTITGQPLLNEGTPSLKLCDTRFRVFFFFFFRNSRISPPAATSLDVALFFFELHYRLQAAWVLPPRGQSPKSGMWSLISRRRTQPCKI